MKENNPLKHPSRLPVCGLCGRLPSSKHVLDCIEGSVCTPGELALLLLDLLHQPLGPRSGSNLIKKPLSLLSRVINFTFLFPLSFCSYMRNISSSLGQREIYFQSIPTCST